MGTTQSTTLNTDTDGIRTSSEFGDRGDGAQRWLQWRRTGDGGDATQGAMADAAVTNPASSGSVVALLKGVLTFLRVSAAALGKAEDAAHASGDTGVMSLAVRRDTAAASSGTTGDYEPLQTDAVGRLRTLARRDPTDVVSVAASVAEAASLVVKTSAGVLHAIVGYSTAAQWIHVYDASSLPANGAVPKLSIPVAAGAAFNIPLPGHSFATGIVIGNSSTGPTKTVGSTTCFFTAYYE